MIERKVVYCGLQKEKFLILSLISGIRFNELYPNIKIYIITDISRFQADEFKKYNIEIIKIPKIKEETSENQEKYNNRIYKITNYQFFQEGDDIMFIDSDILPIVEDESIWDDLNSNNLKFCLETGDIVGNWSYYNESTEGEYSKKIILPESKHYNSGIFLYKNTLKNRRFFDEWLKEWEIYKQKDQLALVRAIKKTNKEIVEIDPKFNLCPSRINHYGYKGEIVNLHLRSWVFDHSQLVNIYNKYANKSLEVIKDYYLFDQIKAFLS